MTPRMIDLSHLLGLRRHRSDGSVEPLYLLRYHGLWGPGVRLLQNQRFRSKIMLLLLYRRNGVKKCPNEAG